LLASGVAGGILVLTSLYPGGSAHTDVARPVPTRPSPDPASRLILRRLAAKAERAPRTGNVWSNGRDRVLTHLVEGEFWRLAEHDDATNICWVLLVPKVSREGTCGSRRQVRSNAIIVYIGAKPDPNDPRRWAGLVVYGRASARVHSLEVGLSDCSVVSVDLSSRPLFWTFLPAAKLEAGVLPREFDAALAGGAAIRGPLSTMDSKSKPPCLPLKPRKGMAATA
jgi:hypothetical protein